MFHKLSVPWPWAASPLGLNVLLSIFKDNTATVDKYLQIAKVLDKTDSCRVTTKIFISSLHQSKDLSDFTNYTDIEVADFSKNANTFTNYINHYGQLRHHDFCSKTELIFANICTFQSPWAWESRKNSIVMKLFNSFGYTQDINYEGRLLILPLQSKFKLVLLLPNEAYRTLFKTLYQYGLSAAINSIQPLFIAEMKVSPPTVDFRSRVQIQDKIAVSDTAVTAVQYGSVSVSDKGAVVKVMTCMYFPACTETKVDNVVPHLTVKSVPPGTPPPPPYYFAIIHDDTPIFIGDFKKPIFSKH